MLWFQVIEIDLSTLEPHVNGPFTPDLATPISKLGATAKQAGWPLEVISVNRYFTFSNESNLNRQIIIC
jgi:aconitase A